jgi:hypothetical protein
VEIDLFGTDLGSRMFDELRIERMENDWIQCRVHAGKFEGFCGPGNLRELLLVFLSWSSP